MNSRILKMAEEMLDIEDHLRSLRRMTGNFELDKAELNERLEAAVLEEIKAGAPINSLSNASGFSRTKIRRIGGDLLVQ